MNLFKQKSLMKKSWFRISMICIFFISISLHFWGLGRFNTLVFDEVYYTKFAYNYLTHTPLFDAHPPLGKYIIAMGIWIGNQMPFGKDTVNSLAGIELSTFSYRWLNALTGSFIPLIVGGIAYQLSHRRRYALIAAVFVTVDGLLLVESRYALINIYLIFFGLLGQWFFLIALTKTKILRQSWLILAGICFGASISVKWNGLFFLLGVDLFWIIAWLMQWLQRHFPEKLILNKKAILQNLTEIKWYQMILNLGVIPLIIYSIIWIPHLQINNITLWEVQTKILQYHQQTGGNDIHPYCSSWYTWLLMIRPMAYFYQSIPDTPEKVAILPSLPIGKEEIIYDVHAMGNPLLWWLSTAAILLLILVVAQFFTSKFCTQISLTSSIWIALYLIVNYSINLLPWMRVSRCTFIYHYMGASIFSGLALAAIVDKWLTIENQRFQSLGITVIILIILAFIFWLPVYLGLPLSPEDFRLRMLLPSWI